MDQILNEGGLKRRVGQALFALLAVGALYLLVLTLGDLKNFGKSDMYPNTTISVSGEGESVGIPDTAVFSFTVTEEAETVAAAQDEAEKKIAKAMEVLKKADIGEGDIKTLGYNIYPKYDYPICDQYGCNGNQVIRGYEVSQTTEVKVRKLEKAGDLLSGVGNAGVTSASGLTFSVEDEDSLKEEARNEAIADAKDKAGKLAKALGVRLVKVVSFYEEGDQPTYYGMDAMSAKGGFEGSAPAPRASVSPGENKFSSRVSVTYEIR